ncbi:MAG: hypothetical protein DI562_08685 [Stenotrophomonas acidaminiphila]|nr:MAG: hypothetical protein DI562_08685 [Stenotrophomonas acidaminiphila]
MGIFEALIRLAFPDETRPLVSDSSDSGLHQRIGIHVFPYFGEEEPVYVAELTDDAVRQAIRSLDWEHGFHQVIVVREAGVSMETSGSLLPAHGLSVVHEDRTTGAIMMARVVPETIPELEAIQLAFIKGGDAWRSVREFYTLKRR